MADPIPATRNAKKARNLSGRRLVVILLAACQADGFLSSAGPFVTRSPGV